MKNIEINIYDYISESEIKEIIKESVRDVVSRQVRTNMERIITNSAYDVVWSAVDDAMDGKAVEILNNKVLSIIDGLNEFNVFRKPDAWGRDSNSPYDMLKKAVENNVDVLEEQVRNKMTTLSKSEINAIAKEVMKEKLTKIS